MATKTAGTQAWFRDPENGAIIEVECATTITGITAARSQIDVTCLASQSMQYQAGMNDPGQASIGLNFDPSEPSHIRLHELFVSGETVEWAIGWSDGTSAPTAGTADDFELPADRSWLTFPGYISDFPFDFAVNAVVTSNMTVQLSDFPTLTPAT